MELGTLKTERLQIRPLVQEDVHPCHQLYADIGWTDAALSAEENWTLRREWVEWSVRN